jgi:hypothetical protein
MKEAIRKGERILTKSSVGRELLKVHFRRELGSQNYHVDVRLDRLKVPMLGLLLP